MSTWTHAAVTTGIITLAGTGTAYVAAGAAERALAGKGSPYTPVVIGLLGLLLTLVIVKARGG